MDLKLKEEIICGLMKGKAFLDCGGLSCSLLINFTAQVF